MRKLFFLLPLIIALLFSSCATPSDGVEGESKTPSDGVEVESKTPSVDPTDDSLTTEEPVYSFYDPNAKEDPNGHRVVGMLPRYASAYAGDANMWGFTDCGPALQNDKNGPAAENSYMVSISATTEKEFDNYLKLINANPFSVRKDEAGKYVSYYFKGDYYYLSYYYATNVTRIIQDRTASTNDISVLNYGTAEGPISIFQYSLNYTNSAVTYKESGAMDCGMLYIILFPDNSVILIDSGHGNQVTAKSLEGFYQFLRMITRTSEPDQIHVRAWFFTHAHGDHTGFAAAFLGQSYGSVQVSKNYSQWLQLDSVMFNFPSYQVISSNYAMTEVEALRTAFAKNFPDVTAFKLHHGQMFELFGAQIEVLYTWEDSVAADGSWNLSDFNSSGVVLKMTYGAQSIIFLADVSQAADGIIRTHYTSQTLGATVAQIAHHGFNRLGLYGEIKAPYCFVPQSQKNAEKNTTVYNQYSAHVIDGKIMFADIYTWEVQFNGTASAPTIRGYTRYDA